MEKRKSLYDRQKKLDVIVNGKVVDTALVDIAVIADQHVGSRAVWDPDRLLASSSDPRSPDEYRFYFDHRQISDD